MRNGIYRVWYKNADNRGVAAVIMADGKFIACDRTHNFLGCYTDTNGRFAAEVEVSRHSRHCDRPEFPDLDVFHMIIEGRSSGESIVERCTFREQPGHSLDAELVWCSEV
jgi:hypothetical protein